MRGWLVGAPLAAALVLAAIALGEVGGGSFAAPGTTVPTAKPVAVMPGRTLLTTAEAEAAERAGLLPASTKSLLDTEDRLRHGDYDWDDKNVPAGKLKIWIDLRRQMISVFRGGHEIGTSVIVYGADGMRSPVGRFQILKKAADYHSRAYDAPMPFSMFITNTGVALHGSPMSSRHATHGCIGLPTDFAKLLFEAARLGDDVEVVTSDPGVVRAIEHSRKS